jgi:hypothetical protein
MSSRFAVVVVCVLVFAAFGCKKKDGESVSGGTESTSAAQEPAQKAENLPPPSTSTATSAPTPAPTPAPTATTTPPAEPAEPLQVESTDIMSREPVTQAAQVRHILIGWADIAGPRSDRRAYDRTREEADRLALDLLRRVRNGENMEAMMSEYSEDPGSAQTGEPYPVRPQSDFVPEFEALALRLNVGEAGICKTQFGYHIMKRIQ